ISDEAFFDVLETTTAPVIASHSSVRAICDNVRNLSDDMLKALAENGGVIQICIYTEYVKKPKPNPEREQALAALREKYGPWEDVKDQEIKKQYRNEYYDIREKYPVEKATVADVVDHIDHVVELIGIDHVGIGTDFDGGGGVIGCDDVSEMPNITRELVRLGYSDKDIEKIWGGNFMRVFREVTAHAAAN
ncbi:MAG: membrane dipeptidase, partial [Candidatus Lokiarchaeota archaeon]|nr:membrane dipeptidase [Candidatus Lokiarchaeota archaeon]